MLLASLYVSHLDDHEKSMARLYEVFAGKLPAMSDFWTRLVHEEEAHSKVLQSLNFFLKNEKIGFSSDKFAVNEIRESEIRLIADIEVFNKEGISQKEALEYAFKMEKEIIESDFFEIFETFTPNMKEEFIALRKHTEEHIKRIENAIEIENNSPSPEKIS